MCEFARIQNHSHGRVIVDVGLYGVHFSCVELSKAVTLQQLRILYIDVVDTKDSVPKIFQISRDVKVHETGRASDEYRHRARYSTSARFLNLAKVHPWC